MPATPAARMAASAVPTSAPVTNSFAVGLGSLGSSLTLVCSTTAATDSTMTNARKTTRKMLPPLGLEKSSGLTARGGAARTSAAWIIEFMVCSFLPWWVGQAGPGVSPRAGGQFSVNLRIEDPAAGQTHADPEVVTPTLLELTSQAKGERPNAHGLIQLDCTVRRRAEYLPTNDEPVRSRRRQWATVPGRQVLQD